MTGGTIADSYEVRDITKMTIHESRENAIHLLFGPERILEGRILDEQVRFNFARSSLILWVDVSPRALLCFGQFANAANAVFRGCGCMATTVPYASRNRVVS